MKRIIVFLFAAMLFSVVQAQNTGKAQVQNVEKAQVQQWDFIAFTLIPGIPPEEDINNVYGVKVGLPIGCSKDAFVAGVECSVFGSMTPTVNGVQCAILFNSAAKEVCGLQATSIYNQAKKVKGVQFSLVNYAEDGAFQVGLINIIKNSPVKFFPLINFNF